MKQTMTTIEYAQMQLKELQTEQEAWMEKNQKYQEYKSLPFWKKLFATKVERPYFSRCMDIPLLRTNHLAITFRMYFREDYKEISYCINEDGYGYKINMDTYEKSPLIGSKGMKVSLYAETVLEAFINSINPLIIE